MPLPQLMLWRRCFDGLRQFARITLVPELDHLFERPILSRACIIDPLSIPKLPLASNKKSLKIPGCQLALIPTDNLHRFRSSSCTDYGIIQKVDAIYGLCGRHAPDSLVAGERMVGLFLIITWTEHHLYIKMLLDHWTKDSIIINSTELTSFWIS